MQDEIVARLANALNAQFVAAEARRAEKVPSPDSMDVHFQGLAWFSKGFTPNSVAQARGFFDRALSADPDNVDALIGSAGAEAIEGANSFVTDPIAAFADAEAKWPRRSHPVARSSDPHSLPSSEPPHQHSASPA